MSNTTPICRPPESDTLEHAPSYYAATANAAPVRPGLDGDVRADVCVIGAGFTGISAALTLAQSGLDVVVLEQARVGWGASGRNGGQIVNGYSRNLDTITRRYGATTGRALGAMALEGAAIIRERIDRYSIDCDLVDGGIFAAFTARQMRELEHEKRVWEDHGHAGLELHDKDGIAGLVTTDRYVGGMVDRVGGHIHPLNLVLGEAAAFETLGGRIHEHSAVLNVEQGARPRVVTASGSVSADFVLVCANAYIGDLLPEISAKMMPVSSQVIATKQLGEDVAKRLIPSRMCVEDMNYILDYYRITADHRLLFGGGTVYGGRDPASVERKIRPRVEDIFPSLKGVAFDYTWSGNFALTLTRIPHVGRVSPNIMFSHGDSGHGVTTTHLLGRLLGEAVIGQASRFDVWAGLPYVPFPGGKRLRVPLTVLGAWYYGIRDRLG